MRLASLTLGALFVLGACGKRADKPAPSEPARRDAEPAPSGPLTLAPAPPVPALPMGLPAAPANPRVTAESVALGELLFHDPRLSASSSRSCASCHDPAHGYAGAVEAAADGKRNLRRTPALVNLAWAPSLGWDGRYATFAEHLPPHLKGQLGESLAGVAARLAAVPGYQAHFARVGGTAPAAVAQGLEAFVLTRYEGGAPRDRIERAELDRPQPTPTDPIVAGYQLFAGKAQCANCHTPPLYTDHGFHRVAPNPHRDPGRDGKFRTPTLRGASARISLFHAGSAKTLAEAIAQYQQPPGDADPLVTHVKLTAAEATQLLAFLNALTASTTPPAKPVLP